MKENKDVTSGDTYILAAGKGSNLKKNDQSSKRQEEETVSWKSREDVSQGNKLVKSVQYCREDNTDSN